MEKSIKLMSGVFFVIAVLFLGGCASSGGGSSHTYYRSYHDPYPYWGRDVYVHHDYDHRPTSPVHVKPKAPSMGRPSQLPSRPMARPRPSLRRR
jgi:hypothetical protein